MAFYDATFGSSRSMEHVPTVRKEGWACNRCHGDTMAFGSDSSSPPQQTELRTSFVCYILLWDCARANKHSTPVQDSPSSVQ